MLYICNFDSCHLHICQRIWFTTIKAKHVWFIAHYLLCHVCVSWITQDYISHNYKRINNSNVVRQQIHVCFQNKDSVFEGNTFLHPICYINHSGLWCWIQCYYSEQLFWFWLRLRELFILPDTRPNINKAGKYRCYFTSIWVINNFRG